MRRKLLFLLIFSLLLAMSFKALALENVWPESPISPGFTLTDDSTLTDLVRYLYEWGLFLGGIGVLISLIIGGFLYLTSMGDPGKLKEAKDRMFSAVIGLVLLFSIFVILRTINPELTKLTPPSFEAPDITGVDFGPLIERSQKSCEYAIFYKQPYWEGDVKKVDSKPDWPTGPEDIGDFDPRSVRIFQSCEKDESCQKNERGERVVYMVKSKIEDGKIIAYAPVPTEIVCQHDESRKPLTGDVNDDCIVNADDLLLCEGGDMRCDLDGNGTVNMLDIVLVSKNQGLSCCVKDGGACTVELHEKKDPEWWDIFNWDPDCGEKKGNTDTSVHNLKLVYFSDYYIKCVKVVQTGIKREIESK